MASKNPNQAKKPDQGRKKKEEEKVGIELEIIFSLCFPDRLSI